MSVIAYFRIPPARAKRMLRKVECAVSQWRTGGRALGMTVSELNAFTEAFEHPERTAVREVAE